MTMVKEFGGIATVVVGNARKALTIILSFVLFPKPASWLYLLGGVLVFGSLTASAYLKELEHSRRTKGEELAAGKSEKSVGGVGNSVVAGGVGGDWNGTETRNDGYHKLNSFDPEEEHDTIHGRVRRRSLSP